MRLPFVCTGNLCRSPLAEGLTRAWPARASAVSPRDVEVLSAGTDAPAGEPVDVRSAAALVRLGGDPAGLRATPLTAEPARSADLVLAMTRRHLRVVLAKALLSGVETRDLAWLPLAERAPELGRRLDARRAHRPTAPTDGDEDPISRRPSVHDEVADVAAGAPRPLLHALFPAGRPGGERGPVAPRHRTGTLQ